MRQKHSKVGFPIKLHKQVVVMLLLISLVVQYFVPVGSFANEELLNVAGFSQKASIDSSIHSSESEMNVRPLSALIDNNENTPLFNTHEEEGAPSTQVSNDQVIDNEGGFLPPESDQQIGTQAESELDEPGTVKHITLLNRHFGTAPEDFSVTYTVTIAGSAVKYVLDNGALTDYSEPFTVVLGAGEDVEIQIHSEQDATATVQQATVTGNSALLGEETQTAQADGDMLTFTYTPKIAFLVYKDWVDNKNFDRSRPDDLTLQLFKSDGIETPQSISATPVEVDKTTSLNTWVYTYQLPQHNLEGEELHYTVKENVVPEHYMVSYSTYKGAPMIVNTQTTLFTAKVNWRDGENSHHTRPSAQEYGSSLEFYQGIDDKDYTLYTQEPLTVTESGSEWTVTVSELPKYNPDGVPYSYKLVQKPLSLADGHSVANPDGVGYSTQYRNFVNYASLTLAAYQGGMITNILEGGQGFLGHKVWLDDGTASTKAARPAGKYQLYRYPNKPGRSYTSASPVPKMEFAINTDTAEGVQAPIDFGADAIGKGMPLARYDEDGFEYIYFVKEIFNNDDGRYQKKFVDNSSQPGNDIYLFHGGLIQNLRVGTQTIRARKLWMAAAQQNIDKSVTIEAQKKTEENQWESVKNEILSGFVSEDMDKTAVFSLPAFDAVGKPIEYRVVESSVTMKLNDGPPLTAANLEGKAEFSFANQFKDEYTITYSKDNGEDVITNSLKGKVNLKIIKAWSDGAPTENTTIAFEVFRNNQKMSPAQLPEGTILSMTGNKTSPADAWELFIEGLDKYDDKGAPYEYSVRETVPPGYWADYSYGYSTNSSERMTITATVTNYPQGNGPSIYVLKKWLDDGDESSRKPVQVGLFKIGQDAQPLKKVTLTAAGKWESHIAIPSETYVDGAKFDDAFYDGYYIKELAAVEGTQEMPVTYESAVTSPVDKLGELKTSLQVYRVSTEKNTRSSYTITNLRIGTLSVIANKAWVDGNNVLNTRSDVTVTLTRKAAGFEPQSIVLDGNKDGNGEAEAWQAVFTGLNKYDELGALYQYHVSEAFSQPVGHTYSTGRALQRYEVGQRRTGDVATYQFTNRLSETYSAPKVHKIWMDNGLVKRPDIYLTLYRSYTKMDEGAPTPVEYEPMGYIEHRWDTTDNFHWVCIFKSLPRYTVDGYEYTYYVKEEMPIRGIYKTHYYKESPENDQFTSEGKTATTDGYAPMGGTIVNRREDTRDINGIKIWKNITMALPKSEYPTAEITLQYLPYVSDAFNSIVSNTPVNYQIAGVDQKQSIENGGTTFEFLNLPKYDLFGREIQYQLKEESIDGYQANPPQVGYFTLTNTYQADGPMRTIHGTKTFSGNLLKGLGQLAYPNVEIEIYRQMQTAGGTPIGQKELAGTASVSLDETKTDDFYQGHYSMACLTYAPNGQPYRYFAKEKTINGYNSNTAEQQVGSNNIVDFANEYTGGTAITVSGTKTWSDQSNFYHTRPGDVALTLQRRTGTNSWEDVPGLSVEWVKGTETDIQWSYRFEHASLTQYAPNGAMYDYRVKEAAVKGYGNAERIVAANAPSYTANLVNILDTTQLKVSKSWMYALSSGSTVPIDFKESYGILPGALTFEIQRTISPENESSYQTVTVKDPVEGTVTGQTQEYLYQNLPKYDENGNAYTYRAREVKVGNIAVVAGKSGAFAVAHSDGSSESAFTTTVTNTTDAIAAYLQTEWNDARDQDGLRVNKVDFTLTASNGKSVKYSQSKPATSTELTKWPVLRVLVPKYAADGAELTYEASQANPSADYLTQPTDPEHIAWESAPDYTTGTPVGKLFAFQNTHTPQTITLNVEKKWEEFNYSGYRPSSIALQLQKSLGNNNWINDGAEVTLTKSGWSYTWAALPAKANPSYSSVAATGTSNWIRYRVVEAKQDKYLAPTYSATYVTGSSNSAPKITVSNTLETTSVSVTKSWQDSSNQYLSRPIEADGSAKVVMELQRKLEGQGDSQFVAATDAAGNQLTATLTTEKDKDTGKYKDIATHTWSGLPVYNAAGVKYEYRVKETMMGSYAVSYTNSDTLSAGSAYNYDVTYAKSGNTFTVTNKVKAREGTMQLTVKKDWIDNNNQDGVRPASLTVELYRDGEKVDSVVLNSVKNWQHTFTGLPRYVGEGAEESSYSAEEGAVSPYVPPEKLRLAWNSGNSTVTFENLYNPKTMRVTAKKSWADDADWHVETRPESLQLTLKARKTEETAYQTVTVDQAGAALINPLTMTKASGWADVTWDNLPQKKNGVSLEYIVEEESVPGYASSASPVSGTGVQGEEKIIALTNRLGSITHTVEKRWLQDDASARPATVTVALYRKTATTAEVPVSLPGGQPMTFDLTAEDHWAHTWSDLPPCDQAGAQYTYSARETHIGGLALDANNCAAGYERVSQLAAGNKTTIENSRIRRSLVVEKQWEHGAYPMNIKHVVVQLQRQQPDASWADMPGVVREIALGSIGAQFSDLPVYSLLGEPYHYRAIESKLMLTDDETVPAILQEEDPLTGRIGAYRFSTVVEDYKTTITNQLITVGIQGEKIWDDEDNYYAQRPGQIDLTVLNAGVVIAPQPNVTWVKTGNRWSYQISRLPRYNANGTPAVYSVREAVPAGYTAINNPASGLVGTQTGNVTQANLTNRLSTFSISGQKQWVDQANKFGLRPQMITLIVKYNGAAVSPQPLDSQIVWQKSGDVWNYTILGLPKPASAQDAQKYTVEEVVPDHYTKTQQSQGVIDSETFCITGANLTNTLDTGTLKLTKTTVAPPNNTEFSFKLRTKNLEGAWVVFKGMYTHINSLGNEEFRYTDDEGSITLQGGKDIAQESFALPALASTEYEVVEEAHPDYVLTRSSNSTGTLGKNGIKMLQFENTFQSRLAIENGTTNPTDHSRKNVGGKITVVTGTKNTPDQPEVDDYKNNEVAVAWVPDEYYALGRALALFYRPAGSSDFQTIDIPEYLNESGEVKPITDPAFAPLLAVYPNANFSKTGEIVKLTLSNNPAQMPADTRVHVLFIPTLAVENTTQGDRGGTVMVENGTEHNQSDGDPGKDGSQRYTARTVLGKAASGFSVDMTNLTLGLPKTQDGDLGSNLLAVKILPDAAGRFSATVPTMLGGVSTAVQVSGTVHTDKQGAVTIEFDELPIPLDVGIAFKQNASSNRDEEQEFWENVGELVKKGKQRDTIRVRPGRFTKVPKWLIDLVKEQEDIGLEIELPDGKIVVLSSKISPNEIPGAIYYPIDKLPQKVNPYTGRGSTWEISASGVAPREHGQLRDGQWSYPSFSKDQFGFLVIAACVTLALLACGRLYRRHKKQ